MAKLVYAFVRIRGVEMQGVVIWLGAKPAISGIQSNCQYQRDANQLR